MQTLNCPAILFEGGGYNARGSRFPLQVGENEEINTVQYLVVVVVVSIGFVFCSLVVLDVWLSLLCFVLHFHHPVS